MELEKLTLQHVDVQAVLVPLNRPVVSRVGLYEQWPLILIDLHTHEGVVGRSYLAPYLKQSVAYLVPAIHDLAQAWQGQPLAPVDAYQTGRKSLSLVGLEGMSLIAVSGLDMAAWDALAKAANVPLAVLLGGSLAPVPAYNSNGLWLTPLDTLGEEAAALVAEGGFAALKLRLGRAALDDDLTAIGNVRNAVGDDVKLMCDFNQGLSLGDALVRCHDLDGEGLYWFEEPIAYNNLTGYAQLTGELATPVQLGENFYGPRAVYEALLAGAGDYIHAGPDAHRRHYRLDAGRRHRWGRRHRAVVASLPGSVQPSVARQRDRALAGVAGLGRSHPGRAVSAARGSRGDSRRARQRPGLERRRRGPLPLRAVADYGV